jgi:lipopolysaccharide biosynthesis glycosyltransferase
MTQTMAFPERAIHIALTFDDDYWAPAYATMRSVCIKTQRRRDLVFHLVHVGLTPVHKADLDAISREFGATLLYYDLDRTDILGLRIKSLPTPHKRLHPIVYSRLFLLEILPASMERLLFLDSDLYVRESIESLYDIDLEGHPLAAVSDYNGIECQTNRDLKSKRYFDTGEQYFNAGVILFDATKCREIDFVAAANAILTEDELNGIYFDQDILNVVMQKKWLKLDNRWNHQGPVRGHEPMEPFIVHYTGKAKPWLFVGRHLYRRTYRHLMTNDLYNRYFKFRMRRQMEKLTLRLFMHGKKS